MATYKKTKAAAKEEFLRHPASAMYSDYGTNPQGLAQSIQEQGQLEPVMLLETEDGLAVVDGWQRLMACRKVGVAPITATLPEGTDPWRYAAARNMARRQMTVGQRARVALRLLTETPLGIADVEACRMAGVQKRYLADWVGITDLAAALREPTPVLGAPDAEPTPPTPRAFEIADLLEQYAEEGVWSLAQVGHVCRNMLAEFKKSPTGMTLLEEIAVFVEAARDDPKDGWRELALHAENIAEDEARDRRVKRLKPLQKKVLDRIDKLGVTVHEVARLRGSDGSFYVYPEIVASMLDPNLKRYDVAKSDLQHLQYLAKRDEAELLADVEKVREAMEKMESTVAKQGYDPGDSGDLPSTFTAGDTVNVGANPDTEGDDRTPGASMRYMRNQQDDDDLRAEPGISEAVRRNNEVPTGSHRRQIH